MIEDSYFDQGQSIFLCQGPRNAKDAVRTKAFIEDFGEFALHYFALSDVKFGNLL